MKERTRIARMCPLCHSKFTDAPAVSRTDGETLICPDCGIRQALAGIGVDASEQEEILVLIHKACK